MSVGRLVVANLILMAAYVATAKIGLHFALVDKSVTLVWPPSGIALAALVLWGPRMLPGVAVGAFLANVGGGQFAFALMTALGNSVEVLVGALLLCRGIGFRGRLDRIRDVIGLPLLVAPLSAAVAALAGALALQWQGRLPAGSFLQTCFQWWLGDLLGMVVVTPVVLSLWIYGLPRHVSMARTVEAATLMSALPLGGLMLFGVAFPVWPALSIIVVPVLIVVAFRFAIREVTIANFLVAAGAVVGVAETSGSTAPDVLVRQLLTLAVLLLVSSLTAQILAVLLADRRRTEEALRAERQQLLNVLEFLPDPAFIVDAEKRVTVWNHACERMTGVKKEALLGRGGYAYAEPFFNPVRPTLIDLLDMPPAEVSRTHREVIVNGETLQADLYVPELHEGTGAYLSRVVAALRDHEGRRFGAIECIRDVTAQRRAQEALYKSEQAYRELVENANSIILRWDATGRIRFINEYGLRFFGYTADELFGRHVVGTITPRSETGGRDLAQLVNYICADPAAFEQSVNENIRRNGERVWVAWTNRVRLDSAGQLYEILSVGTDITALKRAEEELAFKHTMLATQQELSLDGILVVGPAGDVISYNTRFVDMWGIPSDATQTRLDAPVLAAVASAVSDSEGFIRAVRDIYGHKTESSRDEILLKDGRTFDRYSAPLAGSDGRYLGRVWFFRDITERKRAAELEVEKKAEAEANRAKSLFLATMSHEIRTPMNGVIGTVDVLRQTRLTTDQAELLDIVRESAQALLAIINDILDYSKIEAGKMELDLQVVSLGELVESVCNALSPVAMDKCVELTCFADPQLQHFESDSVRLRQVITNLVGNAIKFSAGHNRRPRVSVRAQCDGPRRVRVSVTDNGIGMSPEVVASLFSPFSQADGSITRRFGGTGLGLSICKNLVAMLNGTLDVESTAGNGSQFAVCLPIEPVESPPDAAAAVDLSGLVCRVVSDDAETREDWRTYLEAGGATVTTVGSLAEAAQARGEKASGQAVPVVVVDSLRGRDDERDLHISLRADCRYLFVKAGPQRAVRETEPGVFVLYGKVIRRTALVHGVAQAAGRAQPEPEAAEAPVGLPAPPSREQAMAQGRLILVAEDNEINRKVISHQMAILGHACDFGENGVEALALWRSGNYGLLVTDLQMPVMDGYTLAMAIRREEHEGQHIPIVAFTANISRGERDKCAAAGMDAYLTKPAPLEMLRGVLQRWLPEGTEPPAPPPTAPPPPPPAERASAPSQGSGALLDTSVLTRLIGQDPILVAEFLAEYLGSASKALLEIRTACADRDWRTVAAGAHRLKSSSRSIGAMLLGDCCERLERAAKANDGQSAQRLVEELEQDVADVVTLITSKRST